MKCPKCGSTIYSLTVGLPSGARPCVQARRYCVSCDKVYRIKMEIEE